jgi:hypothetical protein
MENNIMQVMLPAMAIVISAMVQLFKELGLPNQAIKYVVFALSIILVIVFSVGQTWVDYALHLAVVITSSVGVYEVLIKPFLKQLNEEEVTDEVGDATLKIPVYPEEDRNHIEAELARLEDIQPAKKDPKV